MSIRDGSVEELYSYDIVINNVKYPNTFQEDVCTDRTMLEEEFANQSAKYAYWSTLCALAKDQEAHLKRVCDIMYSKADAEAREEARQLADTGDGRKFTEKMFESMAKTNQKYQQSQLDWLAAKKLASLMTTAEHSMAQRKEMLISLGAHARVGANDVRVMSAQVRERVQREPEDTEQTEKQEPEKTEEKAVKTSRRRRPTS